jgi:hypothetical protein
MPKQNQKGGNMKNFLINDRDIKIVGVSHNQLIDDKTKENIFNFFMTHKNSCFLVEEDYRLPQKNIMTKTIYEPNTKFIINQLKKLTKKCINGWDIRPSKLGHHQTGLYGSNQKGQPFFIQLTLDQLVKFLIRKTDNPDKYKKQISIFSNRMNENDWNTLTIDKLVRKKLITVKEIENVIFKLRENFKEMADKHLLKIIKENTKKDYIIILGMNHYNNFIRKLRS